MKFFPLLAILFVLVTLSCGSSPTPIIYYSISGTVSGAVVSDVKVTLTGASGKTAYTDDYGNYSFEVVNGSYTVTPSLAGYTFNPASIPVTVNGANVANQNFTATTAVGSTYAISGTVSGAIADGVLITLSGTSTGTTTTSGGGRYSFSGLANGSYTLTPSLAGYAFSPVSITVPVSGASVTGQNFVAAVQALPALKWDQGSWDQAVWQ